MVGNLLLDFLGRGDATYKQARQWVWERKLMGTSEDDEYPVSVIVLTVAHLDHDVQNNDLENLKCLCQRCHLNHDRRDNIRRRRYGRKGQFYGQLTIQL